jgi:hypothetical protein
MFFFFFALKGNEGGKKKRERGRCCLASRESLIAQPRSSMHILLFTMLLRMITWRVRLNIFMLLIMIDCVMNYERTWRHGRLFSTTLCERRRANQAMLSAHRIES